MKLLLLTKYILCIIALVLLFINWKIAVGIYCICILLHVLSLGPNVLFNTLSGGLIISGIVYIFIDWRVSVPLVIGGYLVAKFHVWGNQKNMEYYGNINGKATPLDENEK